MNVVQARRFAKQIKRLGFEQRQDLKTAILHIMDDTDIGYAARGDLAPLKIYKFKIDDNVAFLAYTFDVCSYTLKLVGIGLHEGTIWGRDV